MATVVIRKTKGQYRVRRMGTDQDILQRALIDDYRQYQGYRNKVAADLHPAWRRVRGRFPEDGIVWLHDVVIAARKDPDDPNLSGYLRLLCKTVGEFMGLKVKGQPAPWALDFVHADAFTRGRGTRTFDPGHGDEVEWRRFALKVNVTDRFAELWVTRGDGPKECLGGLRAPWDEVFRQWDELRQWAIECLDRELNQVRDEFERIYKDRTRYLQRNSRTLDRSSDLAELRRYLMATPQNRDVLDDTTDRRLRRYPESGVAW